MIRMATIDGQMIERSIVKVAEMNWPSFLTTPTVDDTGGDIIIVSINAVGFPRY